MKRLIIFISLLSTLSLAMAFNHPGLLHSKESIQRMRSLRAEENAVAMGSYQKLVADAKASASYKMNGPYCGIYNFDNTKKPEYFRVAKALE